MGEALAKVPKKSHPPLNLRGGEGELSGRSGLPLWKRGIKGDFKYYLAKGIPCIIWQRENL
jgi:hypothetical protein